MNSEEAPTIPVVLFIDNDDNFLHLNEEHWKENHRNKLLLITLNPEKDDPVIWVHNYLVLGNRLDAIFIDQHMQGRNGLDILTDLRNIGEARYLPMIMMTAYPDDANDTEALEKGAVRYIYKSRGSGSRTSFLDEALFSLNQLRDQIEDTMWIDLLSIR